MSIGRQRNPSLDLLRTCKARSVRASDVIVFVRAWRDLLRTNVKSGSAFRLSGATLRRAERLFVAQTFGLFRVISGSRVDGRVRRTSKAYELRFCGLGWRGAALLYRRVAAVIRCCSI